MNTTVAVSEETRKRLMRLKLEEGARSVDEILQRVLADYRRARFLGAAELLQTRLAQRGLKVEDLLA